MPRPRIKKPVHLEVTGLAPLPSRNRGVGARPRRALPTFPRLDRESIDSGLMCYSASMRSGRTKTTSFSLDDNTLKNLKALAARRHNGNVSALLAEVATREAKFAAAEAYFEKYGIPQLTPAAIERIEAEWQGVTSPKKRRRKAA